MKNKFLFLVCFFVFVLCFFIFYQSLKKSNLYSPSVSLEKEIPYFKIRSLTSNKITDSEKIFEEDTFYLLNIWSSWCAPCRDEHSILMKLSSKESLKIIGLNYKDENLNAKNFLNELGNPYSKVFIDKSGTIAIEWGAYGVPESFLINDKKKIIRKFLGPLNNKSLYEIETFLK